MNVASTCRWLAAGLLSLFVLSLVACGGGDTPPAAAATPASITLSASVLSVGPGQTLTVGAVVKDGQGNVLTGQSPVWVSSNPAVATVVDGVVTGVAQGTVTISASIGSVTSNSIALSVAAPPGTTATSAELIDAALAAGDIDAETALTYKVFAVFKDPRLPAKYTGDDAEAFESPAVADLIDRFDTLSAAAQDMLAPFLRRPSSVGSWLDPAVRVAIAAGRERPLARQRPLGRPTCNGTLDGWAVVDLPTAQARVWYEKVQGLHGVIAARMAGYIENDVWPKLVTQLGFARPMDDSSITGCDGGDGKLDIYVVTSAQLSDRGQTIETFASVHQGPVHILIRDGLTIEEEKHAVSHEFTHAIHWAYVTRARQKSYGWFRDGFANWGTDQVYPGNTSLNKLARCHLLSPFLSLDDEATGYCSSNKRNYGGYLPLQFISKTLGTATVRQILANTLSHDTAIESIDNTVSGGFKELWPKYARTLWNQEPVLTKDAPNTFNDWDTLSNVPVHEPVLAQDQPNRPNKFDANVNGDAERATALERKLNNLSVKYYHFTFSDAFTRSVMFHNTFYNNWKASQAVSVRAFFKVEGRPWDEEDWTPYEWIGLCRDFKLQRLEELVIVIASGEWQGSNPVVEAGEPPQLMRNVVGCWGFKGTAKRTDTLQSGNVGTIVASFDATFDTNPGGVPTQYTQISEGRLRVPITSPLFTGGGWTLDENYFQGACTYRTSSGGSSSSTSAGGSSTGTININSFNESLPPNLRQVKEQLTGTVSLAYVATGLSAIFVNGQVFGTDCGTTYQTIVGPWLLTSDVPPRSVIGPDGRLKGTYPVPGLTGGDAIVYSWDLAPIRQP